MSAADRSLAVISAQDGFSSEQIAIIKSQVAPEGTTNEELALFLMYCQRTGLDPFARQIYLSERRSKKGDRWITTRKPETTIDGFRLIAERTNKYAGQLGPFWCGDDGIWKDVWIPREPPVAAKVGILRHDFKEPLWAIALYDEYVQKNGEGKPNSMWVKMPANQLAKCAESLGHRRAFPRELSGLYTREEMAQEPEAPRESQAQVAERRIAEERAKVPAEAVQTGPEEPAKTKAKHPNYKMLQEFRGVKGDLRIAFDGDEVYHTILGNYGYEHSNEIPSKEIGIPIYKALKQALADKMAEIQNEPRQNLGITDEDLPENMRGTQA